MMRHQVYGIHARTNEVDGMVYAMDRQARPAFHIQWLTDRNVRFQQVDGYPVPNLSAYSPVDMRPQMVEVKDLEDMQMFAGCLARTQELIVDPDDVTSMMDRILALQDPARQEYYKRQLRANREEGVRMQAAPRQQFHAQVVSLVA
jgi:hypothetical protein